MAEAPYSEPLLTSAVVEQGYDMICCADMLAQATGLEYPCLCHSLYRTNS